MRWRWLTPFTLDPSVTSLVKLGHFWWSWENSIKLKTGRVDLKTILHKIPKIYTFPLCFFRYDMATWWGGWASPQLLNFSRKICLSGRPAASSFGAHPVLNPKKFANPWVILCHEKKIQDAIILGVHIFDKYWPFLSKFLHCYIWQDICNKASQLQTHYFQCMRAWSDFAMLSDAAIF